MAPLNPLRMVAGALTSPLAQPVYAMLNAGNQRRAQDRYDTSVLGRNVELLQGFENRARHGLGMYDEGMAPVFDAYGGRRTRVLGEMDTRGGNLLGGYRQREADVMAELEGVGDAARGEINQRWDRQQTADTSDLISRGLHSSTVASGQRRSNERARSADLGLFNENEARSRAALIAALRGDTLGQQGSLDSARHAYDAALDADSIGARERYATNRTGVYGDFTGDYLNFGADRNDIPPDEASFLDMMERFGANVPDVPSYDSSAPWLAGGLQAGGQIGSAALMAAMLSDKNAKDVIADADGTAILRSIRRLPIKRWRYKSGGAEHVGPMAQDFHSEFKVGEDDKTIYPVDVAGVTLAAIKALADRVEYLERKLTAVQN